MRQKLFDAVLQRRLVFLHVGKRRTLIQPLMLYVGDAGEEYLYGRNMELGDSPALDVALPHVAHVEVSHVIGEVKKSFFDNERPNQRRVIAIPAVAGD